METQLQRLLANYSCLAGIMWGLTLLVLLLMFSSGKKCLQLWLVLMRFVIMLQFVRFRMSNNCALWVQAVLEHLLSLQSVAEVIMVVPSSNLIPCASLVVILVSTA